VTFWHAAGGFAPRLHINCPECLEITLPWRVPDTFPAMLPTEPFLVRRSEAVTGQANRLQKGKLSSSGVAIGGDFPFSISATPQPSLAHFPPPL